MLNLNKAFYHYEPFFTSAVVEEKWLLKNLSNVKFLQQFKDQQTVTREEFETTEYYKGLMWSYNKLGCVYGNKNVEEVYLQGNYLLALYRAMKDGTYLKNCRNPEYVNRHSGRCPTWKQMPNLPGYIMIIEGHHRLSCLYVLGKTELTEEEMRQL